MKRPNPANMLLGFSICLIMLSLFSCYSVPPSVPLADWLSVIPENPKFFVLVQEPHVRNLIFETYSKRLGLASGSFADIEKHTDRTILFVTGEEPGVRNTTIVLIGTYSSWSIEAGLEGSGAWNKIPGAKTVWKHKALPLSISNPLGYMIVLTDGNIEETLSQIESKRSAWISRNVLSIIEESDASLYIPDPGTGSFSSAIPFNKEKIPLSEILVTYDSSGADKTIESRFFFRKVQEGRAFETTLRTFIVWLMRKTAISDFTKRIRISNMGEEVDASFSKSSLDELRRIFGFLIESEDQSLSD
jgi:hypothetical protein